MATDQQLGKEGEAKADVGDVRVAGGTIVRRLIQKAHPTLSHTILFVVGSYFAFPFFWLLSSSFKSATEIFVFPPTLLPNPVSWRNYPQAFEEMSFARELVNTLTVTVPSVVGVVISSAMPAYAF